MKNQNQEEAERFVRTLYLGALRREPDQEGFAHYVAAIKGGRACSAVAEDIFSSKEFKRLNNVDLFVPPGHYYSPITNPAETDLHLKTLEAVPVPDSILGITLDRGDMVRTWQTLLPFLTSAPFTESKDPRFFYFFDNPFYSWGDGSVLHAMLRTYKPRRIIEIGSGWSSACMLDTVEKYFEEVCDLTFIEPYPERVIELIGGATHRVEIIEKPVQQIPLTFFDRLEAGDILFIDSTHILRTGSDVCFELLEVLPRLAKGVIVHIHDMFWPFEYPRSWAVDENRSWNELYAVRAYLTQNDAWRILLFNDYLAKVEKPMIEATYHPFLRNSGGALWLQRK